MYNLTASGLMDFQLQLNTVGVRAVVDRTIILSEDTSYAREVLSEAEYYIRGEVEVLTKKLGEYKREQVLLDEMKIALIRVRKSDEML